MGLDGRALQEATEEEEEEEEDHRLYFLLSFSLVLNQSVSQSAAAESGVASAAD